MASVQSVQSSDLVVIEPQKKHKIGRSDFKIIDRKKLTRKRMALINQTVSALVETNGNKTAASKIIGISVQALIARTKTHPVILEKLEQFRSMLIEDARAKILFTAPIAADKLSNLVTSGESQRMQFDAALQVLDRSGITKPNENNIQVNVLNNLRQDKQEFDL